MDEIVRFEGKNNTYIFTRNNLVYLFLRRRSLLNISQKVIKLNPYNIPY